MLAIPLNAIAAVVKITAAENCLDKERYTYTILVDDAIRLLSNMSMGV